MIYQRVIDVVDVDFPSPPKMSNPWSRPHSFGKTSFGNSPSVSGPQPKRKWDPEDWQDLSEQITSFKRVRILTKEERVRDYGFSSWSNSSPLHTLNASKVPVSSGIDWTSSNHDNNVRKDHAIVHTRDLEVVGKGAALSSEEMIKSQKFVYEALHSFQKTVETPSGFRFHQSAIPIVESTNPPSSFLEYMDQVQVPIWNHMGDSDWVGWNTKIYWNPPSDGTLVSIRKCQNSIKLEIVRIKLNEKIVNWGFLTFGHRRRFSSTTTNRGNASLRQPLCRRKHRRQKRAEKLHLQVMETRKMKLGLDHPDTLGGIANLPSIYSQEGRLKEVETLQEEVIGMNSRTRGCDHLHKLIIVGRLVSRYWIQDRIGEAEKLELQVTEARKKKLWPYRQDTLTSMENDVSTHTSQSRYVNASASVGVRDRSR